MEDQKSLQRAEAQIVNLEKAALEDRREILEVDGKCKSLEDLNDQLQDQVRFSTRLALGYLKGPLAVPLTPSFESSGQLKTALGLELKVKNLRI